MDRLNVATKRTPKDHNKVELAPPEANQGTVKSAAIPERFWPEGVC
jgi:hypothetical protein